MGIGASIFLVAVGAILAFAVTAEVSGIDIATVGWILMIVGIVGFLLSLLFWSTWGGVGTWRRETRSSTRIRTTGLPTRPPRFLLSCRGAGFGPPLGISGPQQVGGHPLGARRLGP